MKPVSELEVGDVFYIQSKPGSIDGPYVVTRETGFCDSSGHAISLAPDTKALSEREAIQLALRQDGRCQDADAAVDAWQAYGFDFRCARRWIRVGCWDAAIAAALRDAGIGPLDVWHIVNPFEAIKGGYAKFIELVHQAKDSLHNTGS
jgi:hypothetical protein